MARRDQASSLFPFLSVLACVIGTLTLMIAALAIGQVAEGLQAQAEDPLELEEVEHERERVRELRASLESDERVREERAAVEAELRGLGVDPNAPEEERRKAVDQRLASAQLARTLKQLERESREADVSIAGVQAELVPRAEPSDDDKPILIFPYGSADPMRPFFVECRQDGLRVYHKNLQESFYLSRSDLDDVAAFRGFLERVRRIRDATVIFLIRPDGVKTYRWAVSQVEGVYVRHAKLPLPGQGQVEFAL